MIRGYYIRSYGGYILFNSLRNPNKESELLLLKEDITNLSNIFERDYLDEQVKKFVPSSERLSVVGSKYCIRDYLDFAKKYNIRKILRVARFMK